MEKERKDEILSLFLKSKAGKNFNTSQSVINEKESIRLRTEISKIKQFQEKNKFIENVR